MWDTKDCSGVPRDDWRSLEKSQLRVGGWSWSSHNHSVFLSWFSDLSSRTWLSDMGLHWSKSLLRKLPKLGVHLKKCTGDVWILKRRLKLNKLNSQGMKVFKGKWKIIKVGRLKHAHCTPEWRLSHWWLMFSASWSQSWDGPSWSKLAFHFPLHRHPPSSLPIFHFTCPPNKQGPCSLLVQGCYSAIETSKWHILQQSWMLKTCSVKEASHKGPQTGELVLWNAYNRQSQWQMCDRLGLWAGEEVPHTALKYRVSFGVGENRSKLSEDGCTAL